MSSCKASHPDLADDPGEPVVVDDARRAANVDADTLTDPKSHAAVYGWNLSPYTFELLDDTGKVIAIVEPDCAFQVPIRYRRGAQIRITGPEK